MLKIGKITIIGSGRVGTSTAFALVCQNIAKEVSMLDINEDILEAECLDLRDAKYFSYTGHVHKGVWEEAKNSQIIVLCAGEVLRPESSVHQVVNANKRIFDDIFGRLGKINNDTVLVVATSPVDAMTQYAQKLSGLPKSQVLGTGTLLDTQRLRVKLGKKFQINEKSVHAYVMGEKGDTSFVPWSHASIAGRKLSEYFSEDRETQSQLLDAFVNKIKRKTDRILTSKHGTNFGIAACIAAICKDIIYDTNAILPLSCWVNEYNCYMSVLCTLGEKGITKIIPLDLTEKEKSCFYNCSTSIWHTLKWLGFEREGFGAVGEKKGFDEKMGMTPGGGLTREESVTGTSVDFGRGQDIGGGLGTDIGGFGKKSFEPLQTNEGWRDEGIGASLKDYGTTLGTTDIRGIGLSKKETDVSSGVISDLSTKPELVGATETTGLGRDIGKTTEVTEKKEGTFTTSELGYDIGAPKELGKDFGKTDIGTGLGPDVGTGLESKELGTPQLGVGNVLSKPLDTDLGIGKEVSGGGLGTPGTTDLGTGGDLSKGTSLTDISPTPKDTSFGGGLGVGQKTELGADVEQGMKKDVSGEFGEKKKLVTEEGVNEPVGRPIRQ